jgi:zinc and cadmium transporter
MTENLWLAVYCALILIASLAGGLIPTLVRLTHQRMEIAISFIAGLMLGVGVLHMLPHALMLQLEAAPSGVHAHDLIDPVMLWLLAGFLVMFFVQRIFHFHHHEPPTEIDPHRECGHDHSHASGPRSHRWAGAAAGLIIHSLMEGVALAASVEMVRQEGPGAFWAGFSTFMVIALHKPFDSMSLCTLLASGGHSRRSMHLVNGAFALVVPIGIALFYLGMGQASGSTWLLTAALAWSAGTFLCLSMSDLLPELQFHRHDRFKLSASLLLGLALAWGVGRLESWTHVHEGHSHSEGEHNHTHDHDDHEHVHP